MTWSASAPSNIALIKYMGKVEKSQEIPPVFQKLKDKELSLSQEDEERLFFKNRALNPSLSYTLNHFVTKVQIEEAGEDKWQAFEREPFEALNLYKSSGKIPLEKPLSESAQKKYLDFFKFLKRFFQIPGKHIVRSQNNFPRACGIASSASSFSALTLAVYEMAKEKSVRKEGLKDLDREVLAQLSRSGSGSSCRSFFSPWAFWQGTAVQSFEGPWKTLLHQLVLVHSGEKSISSSLAHQMIKTSPYFKGRELRVKSRLEALFTAFKQKNWKNGFDICYEEFMDMHSLFETATPSFKYKTKESEKVLALIQNYWQKQGEGPLVTMDAGANVHLLYLPEKFYQRDEIEKLLEDYPVLSSL